MVTQPPASQTPPRRSPARQRILETAHALFYRDGVRATGIDRVIAEAGVTKVTFYRHFPSKTDLIRAFLDYRHAKWMAWFTRALDGNGGTVDALVPTLKEWFETPEFRGCAFINALGELGGGLPDVEAVVRDHKHDMIAAIAALGPRTTRGTATKASLKWAEAVALIVDGTIIRAQYEKDPAGALRAFKSALAALPGP